MKYLIQSRRAAVAGPPFAGLLVLCILIAMFAARFALAQHLPVAPRTGLVNVAGVAVNPTTGKGYVVDSAAGTVHISNDSDGFTRTVKVGVAPTAVAVDAVNGRAYVANAGDGTVSVLDGRTGTVVATLKIGAHPYSIAADSTAGKIYVTRTYSDQLMVIDAATNQVSSIQAGSPDLLAINEKTHTVYLLSYEMGDLAILNTATNKIARTSVGMHAWSMALNPITGILYIGKPGDGAIAVIAPNSITPSFIRTGGVPCAVAVDPETNTVYEADYSGNSIGIIDGEHAKLLAKVPVGKRPEAVAVDSARNRIYAANTLSHSISVIDGNTKKVIGIRPVDAAPYALFANSVQGKVYVAALGQTAFAVVSDQH